MHGYSTDTDEKRVVILFLAALAIALAWVSSNLLAAIHLSMPWWADAPSSIFFYGVLYALFDRHLWRLPLMRKLGLVKTPNLRAAGEVTSRPRTTTMQSATSWPWTSSRAGRKFQYCLPPSPRSLGVAWQ